MNALEIVKQEKDLKHLSDIDKITIAILMAEYARDEIIRINGEGK